MSPLFSASLLPFALPDPPVSRAFQLSVWLIPHGAPPRPPPLVIPQFALGIHPGYCTARLLGMDQLAICPPPPRGGSPRAVTPACHLAAGAYIARCPVHAGADRGMSEFISIHLLGPWSLHGEIGSASQLALQVPGALQLSKGLSFWSELLRRLVADAQHRWV